MNQNLTPEEYLSRIMAADHVREDCPLRRTLTMLSEKWRTHIIYALCRQPVCRFGELKKAVPHITNTMLSATLRDLEALGIVHREQFNEIPPHVEYSLTEKGRALLPVFCELARWGEAYLSDGESSPGEQGTPK
ncbi:MAG: winged helix-turn-helix transcriptional regulator [Candidatus Ventricola sp.]